MSLLDPRDFEHVFRFGGSSHAYDIKGWRRKVKSNLYHNRNDGRSDLSGRRFSIANDEPQMHEGIIPRAALNASVSWHYMIYHEINCFLLFESEHTPNPPSRTVCYWLAVARYGKQTVDEWVDSLPWKVPPDKQWAGSIGIHVLRNALKFVSSYDIPWTVRLLSSPELDQEG